MGWTGKLAGLVVLAAALAAWRPAAAAPAVPPDSLCAAQTAENERNYGIPARLLDSISVVESGRYDRQRKETLAWPWTVTAQGEGKYFPSKHEAIAEVKRLRTKGVKNIDVGCMQVNLMYHPEAFASLDDAFDPATNVAYAARFLKGLFGATGHWVTAASYYHSQTPSLASAYRDRLMKVWNGAATATREAAATFTPVKPGPAGRPVPSTGRVDEMRAKWRAQQAENAGEAKAIAAAYRQARLAEYQLRRARMIQLRRERGLPLDGY
ncbi:transglycosylase SLT domain-containing protein [Magnetospirillum sp. UT-4]|uniref:transglycosylase SLT domain-containing protein n=1 Tax=Magnetospirillum sp. UT-4 TaxID=2681467 RepID=UPI001381A9CC|nr:transglycosylase SLT domain-containing protein [Magnetospirillum sp. UT-4]CAA7611328.1 conserved exported hypothetical protein [Magnetospirillum sp. UT-4]